MSRLAGLGSSWAAELSWASDVLGCGQRDSCLHLKQGGLLHDAEELLLVDLTITIPVCLIDHFLHTDLNHMQKQYVQHDRQAVACCGKHQAGWSAPAHSFSTACASQCSLLSPFTCRHAGGRHSSSSGGGGGRTCREHVLEGQSMQASRGLLATPHLSCSPQAPWPHV